MADVLFNTRVGDMTIPQLRKRLGLTEGPLLASSLNAGSYPTRSIYGDKLLIPAARMTATSKTISDFAAILVLTLIDTFSAETFDTGNLVRSGVADRMTVTVPGIYRVSAQLQYAANAVGIRGLYIAKNTVAFAANEVAAGNGGSTTLGVSDLVQLAAEDYLQVYTLQTSGGSLAASSTTMAAEFVTSV